MDSLADWLRDSYHGRVMYRTTNQGHWNCGMYDGPMLNQSFVWPYQDVAVMPFTWHLTNAKNAYEVKRLLPMGVDLLRADILSEDRPDVTRDPPRTVCIINYRASLTGGTSLCLTTSKPTTWRHCRV